MIAMFYIQIMTALKNARNLHFQDGKLLCKILLNNPPFKADI
jgi:hypothetical protein